MKHAEQKLYRKVIDKYLERGNAGDHAEFIQYLIDCAYGEGAVCECGKGIVLEFVHGDMSDIHCDTCHHHIRRY